MQGRPALRPDDRRRPRVHGAAVAGAADHRRPVRNPLNIIPPDQRPRVRLRFADQRDLLVSGLLDGGGDIAQRPVVVDAPLEKGTSCCSRTIPMYRGETIGSYPLVFNTILNWDDLERRPQARHQVGSVRQRLRR